MTDEFIPIPGYEGLYSINRNGDIYSEPKLLNGRNGMRRRMGRIVRPYWANNGYLMVRLYSDCQCKHCLVHRLIAQAFIPNPDGLPEVNHKDENKRNNRIENLEWCTRKYNVNYGTGTKRMSESLREKGRKISQFALDGSFIAEHRSLMDAYDSVSSKVKNQQIYRCLTMRDKYKTAKGYLWRYSDELLPVKVG